MAAARHFLDAEKLAKCGRFDSAGHLIGFAAECAVKHCVESLRPTNEAPHLHFPELVERAKKLIHGRKKHSLFTLLERGKYMDGWKISIRYSADNAVTPEIYHNWRTDAARTLSIASIRGHTK
jgi:hypothetical protein